MSRNIRPERLCEFCGRASCQCQQPGISDGSRIASDGAIVKSEMKPIKSEYMPLPKEGFCYRPEDCRACKERVGKKLAHLILTDSIVHTGHLGVLMCLLCGSKSRCRACIKNLGIRTTRRICRLKHCRMVLSSIARLERHENVTHSQKKLFLCTLCEPAKEISDHTCLTRHVRKMHGKEPEDGDFQAQEQDARGNAGASFKLQRHEWMLCHAGCGQRISDHAAMRIHLDTEHAEVGTIAVSVRFDRKYAAGASYLRPLIDRSQGSFTRFLHSLGDRLLDMFLQGEVQLADIGVCGSACRRIHEKLLRRAMARTAAGSPNQNAGQLAAEAVADAVWVFRKRLRVLWNANRQHKRKRRAVKAKRVIKRRNAISVEELLQQRRSRIFRILQRRLEREGHLQQIVNSVAMIPRSRQNTSSGDREDASLETEHSVPVSRAGEINGGVYDWQDESDGNEIEADARSPQAYCVGISFLHSLVQSCTTFEQFIYQVQVELAFSARFYRGLNKDSLFKYRSIATAGAIVRRIYDSSMEAIIAAVPIVDGQRDRCMLNMAAADQLERMEGVWRHIWNVNRPQATDCLVPGTLSRRVEPALAENSVSSQAPGSSRQVTARKQRKRPRLDTSEDGSLEPIEPAAQLEQQIPLDQPPRPPNDTGLPSAQSSDSLSVEVEDSELQSLSSGENQEPNLFTTNSLFETDSHHNESVNEADDDDCVFLCSFDAQGRRTDIPDVVEEIHNEDDDSRSDFNEEINPGEQEAAAEPADHLVPSAVNDNEELDNHSEMLRAPIEENAPSLLSDDFPIGTVCDVEQPLAEAPPPSSQDLPETPVPDGVFDESEMHEHLDRDSTVAADNQHEPESVRRVSEPAANANEQHDESSSSSAKHGSAASEFVRMMECMTRQFMKFGNRNAGAAAAMERLTERLSAVESEAEWAAFFEQAARAQENLYSEN